MYVLKHRYLVAAVNVPLHEPRDSMAVIHLIKSGVLIRGFRDNAVEYATIASSDLLALHATSLVFSKVAMKSNDKV